MNGSTDKILYKRIYFDMMKKIHRWLVCNLWCQKESAKVTAAIKLKFPCMQKCSNKYLKPYIYIKVEKKNILKVKL